jgi:hypothetical protein
MPSLMLADDVVTAGRHASLASPSIFPDDIGSGTAKMWVAT